MRITRGSTFVASLITITLLIGLFAIPAPTSAQEQAQLMIIPSQAPQGPDSEVSLQLSGFMSNEPVTIWQTFPDYTVQPIGTYGVSSAGVLRKDVAIDGSIPVGQHHFTARGNYSGMMVIVPFEVLPPVVQVSDGVSIEVTHGVGQATFAGYGYTPRETIAIWLTRPNGTVEYISQRTASSEGSWGTSVSFDEKDPVGQYYITGYGVESERTGVASFIVTGGDATSAAGAAMLEATPAQTRQLDTVQLSGSGFVPGEIVSIWITMSDGTVWSSGKVIALDGTFTRAGYLPALIPENGAPIGTTTFTAYGHTSKLVATASIELYAGSGF